LRATIAARKRVGTDSSSVEGEGVEDEAAAMKSPGLKHFHYYYALAEIPGVWPFFGGTATSRPFHRCTPIVKKL
jgi:hypothetical protein